MHSATLGEGLQKLARYKRLVCPEQISIDVGDGEARLRFEWLLATDDPPPMLTDIIFAGVTHLAQRGTMKAVRPRRLELTRRRTNEAMLRRHFRCEIRFDASHDLLVFDEPCSRCRWFIGIPSSSACSCPGWSWRSHRTTTRGRSPTTCAWRSARPCADTAPPSRRWRGRSG